MDTKPIEIGLLTGIFISLLMNLFHISRYLREIKELLEAAAQ